MNENQTTDDERPVEPETNKIFMLLSNDAKTNTKYYSLTKVMHLNTNTLTRIDE
jgi:hypothetical protein